MTNNSNGAIIQQLKSKQFHHKTDQSEITEDARMKARQDAIEWGKAYKKCLEDYKEEARMIINDKILSDFSGSNKVQSLDLDESMFFELPSPSMFSSNSTNPGNKGDNK